MDQHNSDAVNDTSLGSNQTNAKLKQRSLLPQPGTPKPTVRSTTLSEAPMEPDKSSQPNSTLSGAPVPAASIPLTRGTSVAGSRLGRPRPRSMYQTGSVPTEKVTEIEKTTTSRSMRPPSLLKKPSATPLLGIGRTQSLRRPAVTTQIGQPASSEAHQSRTQPTGAVSIARSNTTRPRTTAERPKSLHVASGNAPHVSNDFKQPEPATTRSSGRLAGLIRSASVKIRPDAPGSGARSRVALKPEESVHTQTKPKELAHQEAVKATRPAFSTLQQHFTPRKAAKAPTAAFLHPAPVTTGNTLPPELVSMQMDLLQLHLLHENAEEVSRHWEMSAKRALRSKFDEVSSMYQIMLEHERSGQEQKNIQALLEWTGNKTSASLVEYIQVLSGPLHELPALVQTGGRFQRHVSAFEQWVCWIGEVRTARQNRTEASLGSIEGLGDTWKAENVALMRKLASFSRDLSGLSQPSAGSSIASIVACCDALLSGLLEELQIMQAVEADVVEKEKEWVETRLQGIAANIGSFLVDEAPAWRT
ncbi:hypothetical protein C7974DRAFT_232442 [Boeremia exigua]|uniref:uncharacterized protein n=1 Tax=Boeremia exigua TaxID=749465 RepID=UPI001E8E344F|nr:uncharacterized protein C7974DRAFT_232442 [Boeremia exigua]KAH6620382.1 hypothetical protein C7974DRAFT_232442 [Boeremia exigua]